MKTYMFRQLIIAFLLSIIPFRSLAQFTINGNMNNEITHPVFKDCIRYHDEEKIKSCFFEKIISVWHQNFQYPEALRKKGIPATVYIHYVVDSLGRNCSPILLHSSGYESVDKEAMRIARFTPSPIKEAKRNGKGAHVSYTIPYRLRLYDVADNQEDPLMDYQVQSSFIIDYNTDKEKLITDLFRVSKKCSPTEAVEAYHNLVSSLHARGMNTVIYIDLNIDKTGKITKYQINNKLEATLDYIAEQAAVQLIGQQLPDYNHKEVSITYPYYFTYHSTAKTDYYQRTQHFQAAVRAFYQNRYKLSIKEYTKSIALDSEYIDAYFNRANCYLKLKKMEEACADFQKAADLGDAYAKAALKKLCMPEQN